MATEYLTVEHLSTKDLIRIFSKICIVPELQHDGTPCWIWTGSRCKRKGYGITHWVDWNYKTHRLIYAWAIAPLPKSQTFGELDHLCRRPSCCNPAHLELVSTQTNVLRSNAPSAINARKTHCKYGHLLPPPSPKGRHCVTCIEIRSEKQRRPRVSQTHCTHGHPLSGDNLYVNKKGHRSCRACHKIASRLRARVHYPEYQEQVRQWRLNNPERYKLSNKLNNERAKLRRKGVL